MTFTLGQVYVSGKWFFSAQTVQTLRLLLAGLMAWLLLLLHMVGKLSFGDIENFINIKQLVNSGMKMQVLF